MTRPHPRSARRPLSPTEKSIALALAALLGLCLVCGAIITARTAYRFANFAEIADAAIISSDNGCFGAYGSGSSSMGTRSTITYEVEFTYHGALYRTAVVRPCDVVPPDFGRGRGAIWVEYDREHPQRIRVLNDNRAETQVRRVSAALVGYLVVGAAVVLRRRTGHQRQAS